LPGPRLRRQREQQETLRAMVDVDHARRWQRAQALAQLVVMGQQVLEFDVGRCDRKQQRLRAERRAVLRQQPPQRKLRLAAVPAVERMRQYGDIRIAERETELGPYLEAA